MLIKKDSQGLFIPPKFRKGMVLVFKTRKEEITQASNNRFSGIIKTKENEYSNDFLYRQIQFGFLKIEI